MKGILWMTNHLTPYYNYLFENIAARLNCRLVAAFRQLRKSSHPWQDDFRVDYQTVVMSRGGFGIGQQVRKLLSRKDYYVVIGGWNAKCYIYAALYCMFKNKSFAIFTDTPKRTAGLKMVLKRVYLKLLFSLNGKAVLLVTGEHGVREALAYLRTPGSRTVNFPWVTDNKFFSPGPKKLTKSKLLFSSVGRIDFGHKGQDIMIKALSMLRDRGYGNFTLEIAGVGKDLELLRNLTSDLKLDDHVKYLGWLEPDETRDLYRRSDFLIHASHFDPYPNCILEALSCGTPVLASDGAGSAADRVEDGYNGYVHAEGNIHMLVNQLVTCIEMNEERRITMSEKARESAIQWTVDYNLRILEQLMRK